MAAARSPPRRRGQRQPHRARQRPGLPPAARPRARPGHPLDALLGRAVQHLGRLRRRLADQGVPQGHPRRQPRHRDPRRADQRRQRPHRRALRLAGWVDESADDGRGTTMQLAMLQQFLRTASDGWELALASVRDLFAEADLHADEVGGDFAGEATGSARHCARCTPCWPSTFPTERRGPEAAAALADAMNARLDAALEVVPELAPYADALRAPTTACATLPGLERAADPRRLPPRPDAAHHPGWKLVDFEGEPAKPLAERRCPTRRGGRRGHAAVLRLRARVVERSFAQDDAEDAPQTRLPGRRVGRPQRQRLPARLRRRATVGDERARAAARLRGRQGGLRGRLRGAQPTAWLAIPLDRRRQNGRGMTSQAHAVQPVPETELDQVVYGRHGNPHGVLGSAPARRRRHGAGAQAAGVRRRGPLGRRHGRPEPRARGHLGRRPARARRPRLPARGRLRRRARGRSTTPTASCRRSARSTCT